MMTFGSLFAGIGGIDLGFERAGMQCVWQVEKDDACNRVLSRHYPNVYRERDINDCGKRNLEKVDVVCGGFPCQDLSVAGKRAGLQGSRSGLFYEMVRIVSELRPGVMVWENVPGLLSSDNGRDFARVLRALADIGYFGAWRVLDAQFFGVAQRRRRVFGVFARGRSGVGRCAEILSLTEGGTRHSKAGRKARARVARCIATGSNGSRYDGESEEFVVTNSLDAHMGMGGPDDNAAQANHLVAYMAADYTNGTYEECNKARPMTTSADRSRAAPLIAYQESQSGGHLHDTHATLDSHNGSRRHQGVIGTMGVRRLTPRECERLQGFPDDWTAGETDSSRYRMIGNAVAVPCAEWIGCRIVAAEAARVAAP